MPEDLMNTTDQPQFDKMAADGVALCTYPGGAKQYAFFYMGLLIKQDDKVLVRDRNGFAIVTVKRLVTVDDPKAAFANNWVIIRLERAMKQFARTHQGRMKARELNEQLKAMRYQHNIRFHPGSLAPNPRPGGILRFPGGIHLDALMPPHSLPSDLLRVLSSDVMNHAREKAVRAMFTKYIDDPANPVELFDFQKSGMEKALRKYCDKHGLRYPGDVEVPNRTNETVTYPSNFTVHKHEEDD